MKIGIVISILWHPVVTFAQSVEYNRKISKIHELYVVHDVNLMLNENSQNIIFEVMYDVRYILIFTGTV